MIRTALVGFGDSARYLHAPFITTTDGLQLTHVVERHGNRAEELYPGLITCRSLDELLAEASVQLVVLNSPNETHLPYARQVLEAGRHLVVEKPLAANAAEVAELIGLSRKHNVMLTVYQNRRWDADFLTVRKVTSQGVLGQLLGYEAHFDRYKPLLNAKQWKEETSPTSGLLYDLGSHLIDQAVVLFGRPQGVWAQLWAQREASAVPDAFDLRLDYGPLKARLRASLLVREPAPRYTVHGTAGSFLKWGIDVQEDQLKAGGPLPGELHFGEEDSQNWGLLHLQHGDNTVRERLESVRGDWGHFYRNVADVITSGAELQVKPEEILLQFEIMDAARQSSQSGCTVALK